jgi:YD repeat-containing protein
VRARALHANSLCFLSLQSRTDPRGITTGYSYDAAGRTTRLSYSDGTYAAFAYDASGNLTQSANANVVNNYTSYDGNNRVTASNVQVAGQTYNFSYGYDLAGDLTSETYPSGRFEYDFRYSDAADEHGGAGSGDAVCAASGLLAAWVDLLLAVWEQRMAGGGLHGAVGAVAVIGTRGG